MQKTHRPRTSIVGSCVSRDAFNAGPACPVVLTSYLARQSFAGIGHGGILFDPAWYEGLNSFEKRCALSDLSKDDTIWEFERGADILIVDYIDERFNLLQVDDAYVSATKHIEQPGFEQTYGAKIRHLTRLSAETTELWAAGAERFFVRALRMMPASQIFLHEALWAKEFLATDGSVMPFASPYRELISSHNDLLERYYAITKQLVPGISSWRASPEVIYADPDHRWSKEPFHYVAAYYRAFLDGFDQVVRSTSWALDQG